MVVVCGQYVCQWPIRGFCITARPSRRLHTQIPFKTLFLVNLVGNSWKISRPVYKIAPVFSSFHTCHMSLVAALLMKLCFHCCHPIVLVANYLGAHDIPTTFTSRTHSFLWKIYDLSIFFGMLMAFSWYAVDSAARASPLSNLALSALYISNHQRPEGS